MLLFKSFKLLQQEKLMVIKKELQHLYHIAAFYKESKESQRGKIAETLSDDIMHHTGYISILNEKIKTNYNKNKDSILHFLTFYDLYNNEIEKILQVVNTIQSKLSQFLQDRFNQYLPIPMTTKRYSSKGFLDYLDSYYSQILKKQKIFKTPMVFWGHVSGFTARQSIEISSNEKDSPTHYIETAYWNYEIPFLLPIITHELGHISLENKESSLSEIQGVLSDLMKKADKYDCQFDDEFLKELASDIFAYTIHGHPYLIVLCHELLGEKFSNQFYNKSLDDISISPIGTNNIKFFASLIRIKTLLSFIDIYDNDYSYDNLSEEPSESQKIVKDIYDIIDYLIIPLDKQKNMQKAYDEQIKDKLYLLKENGENKREISSLAEIYVLSYPGLLQDYIDFHQDIICIPNQLFASQYFNEDISKKIFQNISKIHMKNNAPEDSKKFEKIFIDLTKVRFKDLDCSISKNKFRQLLLDKSDAKPYELTLYKTRTDLSSLHFTSLKETLNHMYKSNPSYIKAPNVYFTFGFFTALGLAEKKESLINVEIDQLLDSKIQKEETPFYQYKYSLIKLWDNIVKNKDDYENGDLHMILQLQLRENTTEATNKALEELKCFFETERYEHKIEIFKALGPKEIIIKCCSASTDNIKDARQKLLQSNKKLFRRSYTILYGDYEKIKENNTNYIMTIVRKKSQVSISNIEECCNEKTDKIYCTSGVTDIQIHWKKETPMQFIFECYDTWTINNYTTDIQTHIINSV